MNNLSKKLWIGGVILAIAVGYLAYAGAQQGWVYYVSVDQFAADSKPQASRVRLMGKVAAERLTINNAAMQAIFDLEGANHTIRINYHGVIPDLFKAGSDVVVEGKRNPAGGFDADVLLTKCASKYDSKHPGTEKPL